jgi:hypothetical protein
MEQCELKNLDFVSLPARQAELLPCSIGFGKGSDHAPTRPVWHEADIFHSFGTDVGVVLEEVVPYSIACGAIDSMIH